MQDLRSQPEEWLNARVFIQGKTHMISLCLQVSFHWNCIISVVSNFLWKHKYTTIKKKFPKDHLAEFLLPEYNQTADTHTFKFSLKTIFSALNSKPHLVCIIRRKHSSHIFQSKSEIQRLFFEYNDTNTQACTDFSKMQCRMGQSSPKAEENLKSSFPPTQGFRHFMETSDRSLVALSTPFCQCGENDLQMSQPQLQRQPTVSSSEHCVGGIRAWTNTQSWGLPSLGSEGPWMKEFSL